ncbi:precorrin-8X methylmutase [Microcoleus sp. herbarium7]|uniref:precorrin-8X methylmutase n=1 Tax=Microcoleus sp. herbarium7 TaxID=3055435 RepID=UPI002FD0E660
MQKYLTIKQLTQAVKGPITPRMVRHYHALGLLSPAARSTSNYRLYTRSDVQKLQKIVALKQQGFQLSHIRKLLATDSEASPDALMATLQQQYLSVTQQIVRLRKTALALEGLLGRDLSCQAVQAGALAQLRLLQVENPGGLEELEQVWDGWDAAAHSHPEAFGESLQHLLPDLSDRSEIEVDLLSKLILACGDCSLLPFVKLSETAIQSAREALKNNCQIVADVSPVFAALDRTRLAHLATSIETLIDDPHINAVAEAEHKFWHETAWFDKLLKSESGCILVIGYAPSVLMAVCEAIENRQLQPALVIGMPIGFSHAPIAKRRLVRSGVPYITTVGTFGGGLLAAVALNALVESLIEKPNCHCHLK